MPVYHSKPVYQNITLSVMIDLEVAPPPRNTTP